MNIVYLLKRLYWDFTKGKNRRFVYLNELLSHIPGDFGMHLRSAIIPKYFDSSGQNILIYQGVKFRRIERIQVGDNVTIGIDNFFQASAGLSIGDNTIMGPGVKIWTINHRFDSIDKPIIEQGYDYKPVKIGKNCWLGANVFVMPGVTIPDGCVVAAGSVVGIKKYPPYSIIIGNPARVIGYRNKD